MAENTQVQLAKIRTRLAVHRTILSYFRTCLALFIGGLALIHYFEGAHPYLVHVGYLLIILSLFIFAIGVHMVRDIKNIKMQQ